jgi:hypothetical protein
MLGGMARAQMKFTRHHRLANQVEGIADVGQPSGRQHARGHGDFGRAIVSIGQSRGDKSARTARKPVDARSWCLAIQMKVLFSSHPRCRGGAKPLSQFSIKQNGPQNIFATGQLIAIWQLLCPKYDKFEP